jgi:PAS domain S-box-containing protein
MSEPQRRAETKLALKDRRIKFSGPYETLHPGKGLAIAGRVPIYDGDKFLGGAVVITRLSTILKRIPELENKSGVFVYQLTKVNSLTGKKESFFTGYHAQEDWQVSKYMRRGNWTLHVGYAAGYISHWTVYLLMLFGLLFSGLGAMFVYARTHEAIHLDLLVKRKTRDLDDRVKELSTIYNVNEVLKDEWQNIDIALSRVVKLIPAGVRYPEMAAARITFNNHEYKTDNYIDTAFKIRAPLTFQDGRSGFIEIIYINEAPPESEGPFMKEERRMLDSLAETIEVYFNKKVHQDQVARSEASLRSLVEASQIGVMLCDKDHRIVATNRKMTTIYEALTGRALQVGDNFFEALLPDRKEYVLSVFNRVQNDFEPVEYDTSYEYLGSTIYVTVSVAPVISGGKSIGVCMVVYDITTRKLMEIERQRIIEGMKGRIIALEEFAKVIATKVSAPLSTILELKSLVKEDMDEQERRKILEGVIISAQQLEDVLNDLQRLTHEEKT